MNAILWVQIDVNIFDNPKTRRLARLLDMPLEQTVGHLVRLWSWVMRVAPDGDLKNADPIDIADGANYSGDPEKFVKALLDCGKNSVGFLEKTEDGFIVHEWVRYSGSLERKRAQGRERFKRYWDKKKQGEAEEKTDTESNADSNADNSEEIAVSNDVSNVVSNGESNAEKPVKPEKALVVCDPWVEKQLSEIRSTVPNPKPKKLPEAIMKWRDLYGEELVDREIQKAMAWLVGTNTKYTDMGRFLNSWLNRAKQSENSSTEQAVLSSEEQFEHDAKYFGF